MSQSKLLNKQTTNIHMLNRTFALFLVCLRITAAFTHESSMSHSDRNCVNSESSVLLYFSRLIVYFFDVDRRACLLADSL